MINFKKYAGGKWIKLDDLFEQPPIVERIGLVEEDPKGKYGPRVVLTLEPSGRKLSLNKTSVGNLLRDLGDDEKDWLEKTVEIFAGEVDGTSGRVDAVLVRGVNETPTVASKGKPSRTKPTRLSDDAEDPADF